MMGRLIKTLTAGACFPNVLLEGLGGEARGAPALESEWHRWPDMLWVEPEIWASANVEGGTENNRQYRQKYGGRIHRSSFY
jgi:hypothetical protein